MEKNIQHSTPEFEYLPEYWLEAEKLLMQEERKRKFKFWGKTSLFVLLAAGLSFYGITALNHKNVETSIKPKIFSNNSSLASKKAKQFTNASFALANLPSKQNEVQLPHEDKSVVAEKKQQNEVIKHTASGPTSNFQTNNQNSFVKRNTPSGNATGQIRASQTEQTISKPIETTLNARKNKYLALNLGLTLRPVVSLPIAIQHATFQDAAKKTSSIKKEIFASLMLYPSYGFGELQNTNEVSFNAGFLVSKAVHNNWSLALGLQYNNYRGMYQLEKNSTKQTSNPTDIVNYYTQNENQTWTPIESKDSALGASTVYVVSYISNEGAPTSMDTVNLAGLENKYKLEIHRNLKEKSLVVGSILLPIEVHYAAKRFRFSGGFSLEYLLHSTVLVSDYQQIGNVKTTSSSNEKSNDFSSFNRTLFNVSMGVDYFLSTHFSIGMKGLMGLRDFSNDGYFAHQQNDRNYNLNFSVQYHWK